MTDAPESTPADGLVPMDAVRDEARRVGALIMDSRRRIGSGEPVRLSGLEALVRAVCAAAVKLPPEQGRALKPELEAVLHDLDAMAHELTERFGDAARRDGMAAPGKGGRG